LQVSFQFLQSLEVRERDALLQPRDYMRIFARLFVHGNAYLTGNVLTWEHPNT